MKKYLVIGNPIEHSLSPQLHSYWIKKNNLNAIYDRRLLKKEQLNGVVKEIRDDKIIGMNVTLPFKKEIIKYIDELTPVANKTQSVNTVLKRKNKIVGDNTDSNGFKRALEDTNFEIKNKIALILGAGGVVPSLILALEKVNISKILISNRTKEYANNRKKSHPNLEVIDWGETNNSDIVINATSLGLNKTDAIEIDYSKNNKKKLFYDLTYNPPKTDFLTNAEQSGNKIDNGKMMFIYQAQLSFNLWHNIEPKIDQKVLDIFKND